MEPSFREDTFFLFVYGTLKRGFRNHAGFCDGVLAIEEAVVRGELYDLPYGFPALVVPEVTVQAIGTTDPNLDVATQHQLSKSNQRRSAATGPQAFGQLLSFDDPVSRLPKLDHLESFDPDDYSLYRRVLIPVETERRTVLAWAYVTEKPAGTYLPDGSWPP
ncbi:gamma-glutamylcyclotransferase [soil metagenome]